ncbi:MAG: hypothetical protein N2C14_13465, partial [Planctomycetales bacterium]
MTTNHTKSIESKLREAWGRQQRFHHVRGASRFVIWLIFMIALDFLIDWGIFFQIRWTNKIGFLLIGVNAAVLAWVLWNEWIRRLQRFDPLQVALEVESNHPELSSLLVSYTQLEGPSEKQPDVSVELIEAMREQAVVQTRKLDFREIVDFAQLRNLLAVAAGVLLMFGSISYLNQAHVQTLFQRLAGFDAS